MINSTVRIVTKAVSWKIAGPLMRINELDIAHNIP